jgi:signal transduction histidine kinase
MRRKMERAEIGLKELHDNVNQILSTARLYLELAKSDERKESA